MTIIDHQQAAIRAIAAALHGDACPADPGPGESCRCGNYERESEIALAAAAPHLRAAWEQEMAEKIKAEINDVDWDYGLNADAYLNGLRRVLALLEGGGEDK